MSDLANAVDVQLQHHLSFEGLVEHRCVKFEGISKCVILTSAFGVPKRSSTVTCGCTIAVF